MCEQVKEGSERVRRSSRVPIYLQHVGLGTSERSTRGHVVECNAGRCTLVAALDTPRHTALLDGNAVEPLGDDSEQLGRREEQLLRGGQLGVVHTRLTGSSTAPCRSSAACANSASSSLFFSSYFCLASV